MAQGSLPPMNTRALAFSAAGGGFGGALLAIIVAKLLAGPCCCTATQMKAAQTLTPANAELSVARR